MTLKGKKKIKSRYLPIPRFSCDQGWGQTPRDVPFHQAGDDTVIELANSDVNDSFLILQNALNENHKAKELLLNASTLTKKDTQKESLTIIEKLVDIYIENALENNVRDGNFIKCNYLEELVVRENLNHLIIKLYPEGFFLYVKNPDMEEYVDNVGYHEYEEKGYDVFMHAVDNEEISYDIFDILHQFTASLFYDHHIFLQIQKFASLSSSAEPVFSTFVLLKPTSSTCIALSNEYFGAQNNIEMENFPDLINKYESRLFFEMSGPLYLDTDQISLELINVLQIYNNPFVSSSLKSIINKKWKSVLGESCTVKSDEGMVSLNYENHSSFILNSSLKNFCELRGSPSFSFQNLKESLHSFLVAREVKVEGLVFSDWGTTISLVEVFFFYLMKNIKNCNAYSTSDVEKKYKLPVYRKNGLFYTSLILDEQFYYCEDSMQLYCVGSREKLDKYILKVADLISSRFSRLMKIKHNNAIDDVKKCFFNCKDKVYDSLVGFDPAEKFTLNRTGEMQETRRNEQYFAWREQNYSKHEKFQTNKDSCALLNEMINSNMPSFEMDEGKDNYDISLSKEKSINSKMDSESVSTPNDSQKAATQRNQNSPMEMPAVKNDEDSSTLTVLKSGTENFVPVLEKENTTESFVYEAFTFETDSVKSIFEAHPFELGKSIVQSSLSIDSRKKRTEIYHSLKAEFKYTPKDFMPDLLHLDSMKSLLKLICESDKLCSKQKPIAEQQIS